MRIHKEGIKIIGYITVFLAAINVLFFSFCSTILLQLIFLVVSFLFIVFIFRFFRKPERDIIINKNAVYAPADGKIVAIEETEENEFLKEKRIQVSIFMSIWNVHINWYPVSGVVKYFKYHPGKFLVAKLPKSSTDNERTTIVVETQGGLLLLVRQIAGAVARRIITYSKETQTVSQGEELGFIRFGSRVDIFLPLSAKINVKLTDRVIGKQTIIALL